MSLHYPRYIQHIDVSSWWGYLSQWNLLDYPTFILPVAQVKADDAKDSSYQPISELDRENYVMYNPKMFEDAPISLQLIGRSMQEEQLLAVAMAVDLAIKS